MNFFERIYDIIRAVPSGQVISYGQVAFLAGNPRMARQVGWALHVCPEDVPWHRVIRKDGSLPDLSPESSERQRMLLEREGIEFDDRGHVLRRYFGDGIGSVDSTEQNSVPCRNRTEAKDALEGVSAICYRPRLTER